MNKETVLEIFQSVENINSDLCEQGFNDGEIELIITSTAYVTKVSFMGCQLYRDDTDFWEEGDYKGIEDYLRNRMRELLYHLAQIHIKDI